MLYVFIVFQFMLVNIISARHLTYLRILVAALDVVFSKYSHLSSFHLCLTFSPTSRLFFVDQRALFYCYKDCWRCFHFIPQVTFQIFHLLIRPSHFTTLKALSTSPQKINITLCLVSVSIVTAIFVLVQSR